MKTILCVTLLGLGGLAFAQTSPLLVTQRLDDWRRAQTPDNVNALVRALVQQKFLDMAALASAKEARQTALNLAPLQQDGAPAAVGSGTSLVSLGSVSDLISAAMESGAFNRTTQGSVATLRANLIGSYRLLFGECPKGAIQAYPACIAEDNGPMRGLSVAFSIDSSRIDQIAPANPSSPATSANALLLRARQGLAAVNVRYDFFRPRDKEALKAVWNDYVPDLAAEGAAFSAAFATTPLPVLTEIIAKQPFPALNAAMQVPGADPLQVAQQFVDDYFASTSIDFAATDVKAFAEARKLYLRKQVSFFQNVEQRKLFTLEYTHQRPKDEREYGSARFIWDFGAGGTHVDPATNATVKNWQVTFNAAADFYYRGQEAQNGRKLRDFQAAVQLDRRLWRWTFLKQPTFTLAGYYQRLTDDMVLEFNSDAIAPGTGIVLPKPANVILKDTRGDVGIAQAKLSIPLGNSGVSVPLAVTWSNRTEFLNTPGNDVRGNFGFLFDMDKLIAAIR